jgi:LysR family transcriptional regulator, glycine cleavage system transcriptional activator
MAPAKSRLPPLNAVRAFESAARHLSFARAAEELSVTPSAISHQVRTLEEFLGVVLFRRLTRQVALTREGSTYRLAINAALDQIRRATDKVRIDTESGPLTMSVVPSFASRWLVPRLGGFQWLKPDIEVRLITSVGPVRFSESDVDLAIRHGEEDWRGLEVLELITDNLVPVCSPHLCEGAKGLKKPEDLRRATLLHVLPRMGEWRTWLAAAGVTGIDPEKGPKFITYVLALEAATVGLGVAIADRYIVTSDLESGRLVIPFDFTLQSENAYYLVYPKARGDDSKVAAFREWLLSELPATADPASRRYLE